MQLKALIIAVGLLVLPALSVPSPNLNGLAPRATTCYANRDSCNSQCAGQCYDIGSKHDCCDS